MKTIFIRSEFNYDMDKASRDSGLRCEDPTLAQQQFKEECDINSIVERFNLTGEVPQLQQLPSYADYEGIFDFQDAMNVIRAAEQDFMALPAKLRARFHNQPQEFLEFCADDTNIPEARKLGILRPLTPEQIKENESETRTESTTLKAPQSKKGAPGAQGDPGQPGPAQKPGPKAPESD